VGKKHTIKCRSLSLTKASAEDFVMDTILMFAQAGIPLEKIDKMKPWLDKWVPDYAGMITSGNQCRRYVPNLLPLHFQAVAEQLKDMIGCSIIADESTDKRKESPVNLLLAPACDKHFQKPILVDIQYVNEANGGESINGAILEQFVTNCVNNFLQISLWIV
jgi:hypothetical protein